VEQQRIDKTLSTTEGCKISTTLARRFSNEGSPIIRRCNVDVSNDPVRWNYFVGPLQTLAYVKHPILSKQIKIIFANIKKEKNKRIKE